MASFMIVDDTSFIRDVVTKLLARGGHTVSCAVSDVDQAFDQYKQYQPDFIFLDINLAHDNGLDLLERFEEQKIGHRTIILSAFSTMEQTINKEKYRIVGFIAKPFNSRKFLEKINAIVENELGS